MYKFHYDINDDLLKKKSIFIKSGDSLVLPFQSICWKTLYGSDHEYGMVHRSPIV